MDPLYMHDLLFYFHPQYQNFQKSIKTIHEFDQTVIEKRRKLLQNVHEKNDDDLENVYGKKKTPFLDILLKARDEDGNPLSNKDIRDQVDGIMFAVNELNTYILLFRYFQLAVFRVTIQLHPL